MHAYLVDFLKVIDYSDFDVNRLTDGMPKREKLDGATEITFKTRPRNGPFMKELDKLVHPSVRIFEQENQCYLREPLSLSSAAKAAPAHPQRGSASTGASATQKKKGRKAPARTFAASEAAASQVLERRGWQLAAPRAVQRLAHLQGAQCSSGAAAVASSAPQGSPSRRLRAGNPDELGGRHRRSTCPNDVAKKDDCGVGRRAEVSPCQQLVEVPRGGDRTAPIAREHPDRHHSLAEGQRARVKPDSSWRIS